MSDCVHPMGVLRRRNRRQDKRERMLRKMRNWRAAKARKRLLNPPPEREPKMRWHRFEIGVRDKIKAPASYGEAWVDLRSVRDAAKRPGIILRYCGP